MKAVCGDHGPQDTSKLWRTIKAIDGKSTTTSENEAIVFNEKPISSPKDIANKLNKQFMLCKDYISPVYMYNIHCISMSHGLVITQYAIHVL